MIVVTSISSFQQKSPWKLWFLSHGFPDVPRKFFPKIFEASTCDVSDPHLPELPVRLLGPEKRKKKLLMDQGERGIQHFSMTDPRMYGR